MNRQTEVPMLASVDAGAIFSPCRTWRYVLWRIWNSSEPPCLFIGLNPSTADETTDDPTVRRCIRFAQHWGFGGLWMMNAYAFRATDPHVMKRHPSPIGDENDLHLAGRAKHAGQVIAAWGTHCDPARARRVCEVVDRAVLCLGKTKRGAPKHPLYLRSDTLRELYWVPGHA